MDYQTFKAVVAGNLINEPEQLKFKSGWLTDDPNKEHWKRLAIEGTYPEAIYATNSHLLLSLLIGEGHGKEHYREWATNGNFAVKSALIRHGYCLDLLVSDYDVNIGMCVVQKEPERIGQLLAVHSWQDICRALSIKKDLPYMLVKTFLEYMPHGPIDSWCALWAEALQLKLEAWQREQTNAFECTMTGSNYTQLEMRCGHKNFEPIALQTYFMPNKCYKRKSSYYHCLNNYSPKVICRQHI